MQPKRRPVGHLHGEHQANHDMADDDDGEIRRRIIGPVMVQRLATSGAGLSHLEIAAEHGAFAASRAGQPRASQQRKQHRTLASRSRLAAVALCFALAASACPPFPGSLLFPPLPLDAAASRVDANHTALVEELETERTGRWDSLNQAHLDEIAKLEGSAGFLADQSMTLLVMIEIL